MNIFQNVERQITGCHSFKKVLLFRLSEDPRSYALFNKVCSCAILGFVNLRNTFPLQTEKRSNYGRPCQNGTICIVKNIVESVVVRCHGVVSKAVADIYALILLIDE